MFKLKNLDKKLSDFSRKMTDELKSEIRAKGHYGSGKLSGSIMVKYSKKNNEIEIELISFDYLKFLDKGKFLKNFLLKIKKELKTIVETEFKKDLKEEILYDLKKAVKK